MKRKEQSNKKKTKWKNEKANFEKEVEEGEIIGKEVEGKWKADKDFKNGVCTSPFDVYSRVSLLANPRYEIISKIKRKWNKKWRYLKYNLEKSLKIRRRGPSRTFDFPYCPTSRSELFLDPMEDISCIQNWVIIT